MAHLCLPFPDRPLLRCRARPLFAGLVALAMALCAAMPATPAKASGARAFAAAINEVRAEHGLRSLRPSARLQRSSDDYSNWMLDEQFFGHSATIRASRRFGLRGEVLANTKDEEPDPHTIVREWLASPSHRAVLLNRRFRFVGIGIAVGWLGPTPRTVITGHLGGALKARAARR